MVPYEQSFASSNNCWLLLVLRFEARTSAHGHKEGVQYTKNSCRV